MNKLKRVFVLLILIFSSQLIQAQYLQYYDKKTSWNGLSIRNLKGKVKSLKQMSYVAIDSIGIIKKGAKKNVSDQISQNVNSDCLILFDTKGRTMEETYYILLGEGGKHTPCIHRYDDLQKTEEIVDGVSPNGEAYWKYIYKYDTKGRIMEYFSSQLIDDIKHYDQKFVYKYDEKGNVIECTYSSSDTKLNENEKRIYKYQHIGNQTITEQYNEKGILRYKDSYKVDAKGNIIEHDYYTADCKILEHTLRFKYDDYGNEIQKEYYTTSDKPTKTWSYKYEYDKQNNWIKRIDFENGKATYILERELQYY